MVTKDQYYSNDRIRIVYNTMVLNFNISMRYKKLSWCCFFTMFMHWLFS